MKVLLVLGLLALAAGAEAGLPWWNTGTSVGWRGKLGSGCRKCLRHCGWGRTCARKEGERFGCCVRPLKVGAVCQDAKHDFSDRCPRGTACNTEPNQPRSSPKYCLRQLCYRRAFCGGSAGIKCRGPGEVCVPNPDENCGPLKRNNDCGGCCVRNTCAYVTCQNGDCYIDGVGKPQCTSSMPSPSIVAKEGDVCRKGSGKTLPCPVWTRCQVYKFTDDGTLLYTCMPPRPCCKALAVCGKGYAKVDPEECTKEDFKSGLCSSTIRCCQALVCKKSEGPDCGLVDCVSPQCPPGVRSVTPAGQCCPVCDTTERVLLLEGEVCRRGGVESIDVGQCMSGTRCQAGRFEEDGTLLYTCKRPSECCAARPECPSDYESVADGVCTKEDFKTGACKSVDLCCQFIVCKKSEGPDCGLVDCVSPQCPPGVRSVTPAGQCCPVCAPPL